MIKLVKSFENANNTEAIEKSSSPITTDFFLFLSPILPKGIANNA